MVPAVTLTRLSFLYLLIFLTVHSSCAESGDNTASAFNEEKVRKEGEVYVLDKHNFHPFIQAKQNVLVEFYASWCGHCKNFAPEYAKAAQILKKEMPSVTLAQVDTANVVDLAQEFGISGVPTIIFFKKGVVLEHYQQPLTYIAVVDYVKQKMDPKWSAPGVMALDSSNFTETVKKNELMLVEFYAPGCRHCQELEPELEVAAKGLRNYGIPVAKVNGPEEKSLADSLKITGWPTLKIFRKGKPFEYKGPMKHEGIVNYMKEQMKPPSNLVKSLAEMRGELDRTEATILGFFSSPQSGLYEEYLSAVQNVRGVFKCLHTFDEDIAAKFDVNPDTIVIHQPEVFHSKYEEPYHEYSIANGNAEDITEFIRQHCTPLVGQRTKKNEELKYQSQPLVVVYYDVNFGHQYVKDTQLIRQRVLEVAKDYKKSNVKFAVSNEDEYADELKMLNLADATEDVKVVVLHKNLRYQMEPTDVLDVKDMKKFIENVLAGKGKPHYRSQPVPKVQKGPVLTVVAKSFDQLIMEAKQDALVVFYTPTCSHCKDLLPIYKKFAKEFKTSYPNLIVAMMDVSANDVHPLFVDMKHVPGIFYIPAKGKEHPIRFDGRPTEEIPAFVKEHYEVSLFSSREDEDNNEGKNEHLEL